MTTWLGVVADFLGCDTSVLNPNLIYIATIAMCAVFIGSIAYVLGRSGRK